MQRRALLRRAWIAAALVGLGGMPVARAAPTYDLVLTSATGNAYVDVTLPAGFDIDWLRADFDGTGGYVGFLARRISDGHVAYTAMRYVFPGSDTEDYIFAPRGFGAGTYRFFVFADSPATVRIGAVGVTANLHLTATQPMATQTQAIPLDGLGPVERTVDFGALGERYVAVFVNAEDTIGKVEACTRIFRASGSHHASCTGGDGADLPGRDDSIYAMQDIWLEDFLSPADRLEVTVKATVVAGTRTAFAFLADISV